MHNELAEKIKSNVSGSNATANIAEVGDSSIKVDAASIKATCEFLKQDGFNVLQVISGVDYPDAGNIEVNYIIADFTGNRELILKIEVPRGDDKNLPKLQSVCDVWSAADWQERETYDLIGVEFEGHPDHRRILCPYDWEGHPLRKDYEVQEVYNGMTVNPAEKINSADHYFGQKLIDELGEKKVSWSWKDKSGSEETQAEE
jgi:NADH-quinone oxidoreductase subunit C